ncbi:uncharacterized protein LOC125945743 [Dermacentor silvarum]|uniref:uncharacterized protein LOC125945743 n=1 Tax=Dermacentor silvarum TaxID=543639 RepID=UPI002101C009|nr:uncharacterized protein LOC125945743 [Dermacentor silvarum]
MGVTEVSCKGNLELVNPCLGKTNITFTELPDLPPANDPMEFVWAVVNSVSNLFAVVLVGGILAVVVPLVGLLVLTCRCVCGLCGGGSEPETKDDLGKRNTWGCLFTVLYMPLMHALYVPDETLPISTRARGVSPVRARVLLVCTIFCVNHLPSAISSLQDHAKFLAEKAPGILWQPLNDTGVLVNTNSDEFQTAVSSRLEACAVDVGVAVDQALTNSPLLKFVSTTAQYLQAADPLATKLVDAVEQLRANMSDLWRQHIHNASIELQQAETRCPGCVPAKHKQQVDGFKAALNQVSTSVDQLKTLRDKMKSANLQQYVDKISQGSLIKIMIQAKAMDLKNAIGNFLDVGRKLFNLTANSFISATSVRLQQLKTYENIEFSDTVKDIQSKYSLGTIGIVVGMAIVCALYTIANQCSCANQRTGLCSLRSGSWFLSGAVFFFLLAFSVSIVASSFGVVVGIGIERVLCHPLEQPTAPECRHMLAFVQKALFPVRYVTWLVGT